MMHPLGARVLVKRAANTEDTRGLIVIPDRAKSKAQEGDVVAVGPEARDVKVGDRVLFGRYQGTEVTYERETYVVLWCRDLMAVLG
jgi:chaperonin GroES